jgi:hypothetical protein
MYISWTLGVLTIRVRRFCNIDFHVRSGRERWLNTNPDGLHLSDTQDYLSIINSECQLTGDDASNIHATYFNVSEVINSTALIIKSAIDPNLLNLGADTHLEFSNKRQQYTIYAIEKVVSSIKVASNANLFIFANPVNVSLGD